MPHALSPSTTPGPEATLPARHPDAPPPGGEIVSHYPKCYGCGSDHPNGLHLRVHAGEGLTLRAEWEVGMWHQGAPGLAHGGVLTAALDETLGALNWLIIAPAVTARLETEFVRPVPVGSRLVLDAAILGTSGRKVYTAAVGRFGPDGPTAVRASALFVQVKSGHFREHGRPADVAEYIARGATTVRAEHNP